MFWQLVSVRYDGPGKSFIQNSYLINLILNIQK